MFVMRSATQPKTTAAALLWKYNLRYIFSLRKKCTSNFATTKFVLLPQNLFCYLVLHLVAKVCYHKKKFFSRPALTVAAEETQSDEVDGEPEGADDQHQFRVLDVLVVGHPLERLDEDGEAEGDEED